MFKELFSFSKAKQSHATLKLEPSGYCAQCDGVFKKASPARMGIGGLGFDATQRIWVHHKNYKALKGAANGGCRLCAVLVTEFDLQTTKLAKRKLTKPVYYVCKTSMVDVESLELQFYLQHHDKEKSGENVVCVTIRLEPVETRVHSRVFGEKTSDLITLAALPSRTDSAESIRLACEWIRDCTANHTVCKQLQTPSFFPTRILDLDADPQGASVRLFVTKDSVVPGPYMTLSHQWGASEENSPLLTQKTLNAFCKSIEAAQLPQVFRDAICLTRKFGVRYLWIDRLCIIQDSPDDWAHEALLMGKVYASSFCSIAASDADTPRKGCFFERDARTVQPWRHIPSPSEGHKMEYLVLPSSGVSDAMSSADEDNCNWRNMLMKSSLYSRGWVLQESILAPRILHCSARQLCWECPSTVCTEAFPRGIPKHFLIADELFELRRKLAVPGSRMDSLLPARGERSQRSAQDKKQDGVSCSVNEIDEENASGPHNGVWPILVEMYTKCQLSYSKDKLIALSGIANNLSSSLGEYAAGLWAERLHLDLLWAMDSSKQMKNPKKGISMAYRAPSWSWASVDGPVSFHFNKLANTSSSDPIFQVAINVPDISTKSTLPGGFGEVTDGVLTLEAMLAKIEVGILQKKHKRTGVKSERVLLASVGGVPYENFESSANETQQMLSLLIGGDDPSFSGTSTKEQISQVVFDSIVDGMECALRGSLQCMPILTKNFFQSWKVNGIIVTAAPWRGPATYRRVGYFEASGFGTPGLQLFQGNKKDCIKVV